MFYDNEKNEAFRPLNSDENEISLYIITTFSTIKT